MADITITPASVSKSTGPVTQQVTAGATITAGQTVYLDASDLDSAGVGKAKLADANLSAAASTVVGIALHAALSGQPLLIQTGGQINIGATVVVGTIYVLSATAGGIAPAADLVTGWYVNLIGVALTAGRLQLLVYNSGVAVP